MEARDFIDLFDDTLFLVKDENGNIVYPTDVQSLLYIRHLKPFLNDEYYQPESDKWYRMSFRKISKDGQIYSVAKYVDVSFYKRKATEYEIDETTGIKVKKKTYEEFNNYLENIIKNPEGFAVVIADIDFFKKVNDTYGHIAGDYVLNVIAQMFYNNTRHMCKTGYLERSKDIVGRIGGEEFLIVLKNIEEDICYDRINGIREKLAETPIEYNGKDIYITCSFGIVRLSKDDLFSYVELSKNVDGFRSIIQREADKQLYISKHTGRNKVSLSKKLF